MIDEKKEVVNNWEQRGSHKDTNILSATANFSRIWQYADVKSHIGNGRPMKGILR